MTTPGGTPSFAHDIRPLFREQDRASMRFRFDLGDYATVRRRGKDILAVLQDGSMPCDEPWPPEQVALFQRWLEGGAPA